MIGKIKGCLFNLNILMIKKTYYTLLEITVNIKEIKIKGYG